MNNENKNKNTNTNTNELIDNKKQEEPVNVNTNDQQVNQNPQNNEKSNKINKDRLIIFGAIIVVLLVIAVSVNLMNKNDQKLEENTSTETNNDYEEDNYIDDTLDTEEKEDSDEVNEEETTEEDDTYYEKGYDGYSIEKVDNNYYLMRNKKEVAKLEKNKNFKLYKDESDKNSKYIAVCDLEFAEIDEDNNQYALLNIWTSVDDNFLHDVSSSILYNINTGKYKIFDGAIAHLDIPNYYILEANNRMLVDASKLEVVSNKDLDVIADYEPSGSVGNHGTVSKKYIVVRKENNGKYLYGLIDLNGNILVEPNYDDLFTTNKDNVILAKKGNKFGAIDSHGKTVVNLEYDGIDYWNNYFILSKNNKLGIINLENKVIVPFEFELEHLFDYKLRRYNTEGPLCDFEAFDKDDKLVIQYFPKGKTSKDGYKGHDSDYLVVFKNGSYKVYEDYKLY